MTVVSFITANFVARELGYPGTDDWALANETTSEGDGITGSSLLVRLIRRRGAGIELLVVVEVVLREVVREMARTNIDDMGEAADALIAGVEEDVLLGEEFR